MAVVVNVSFVGDEENLRRISVPVPPGFAEGYAAREVAPEVLATRLAELCVNVVAEARNLFEDWDNWPIEHQVPFLRGVVTTRMETAVAVLRGSGMATGIQT